MTTRKILTTLENLKGIIETIERTNNFNKDGLTFIKLEVTLNHGNRNKKYSLYNLNDCYEEIIFDGSQVEFCKIREVN